MIRTVFITLYVILIIQPISSQEITIYTLANRNEGIGRFEKIFIEHFFKEFNSKHKTSYQFTWKFLPKFSSIFDSLLIETSDSFGLNGITITKERMKQYDFSFPYLPVKEIIATIPENKSLLDKWKYPNIRIGVNPNSSHMKLAIKLEKKYRVQLVYFSDTDVPINDIKHNKYDLYLADIFVIMDQKNLLFVANESDFEESFLAIMFSKNSELFKQINSEFKLFVHSPFYKKLLRSQIPQTILTYLNISND